MTQVRFRPRQEHSKSGDDALPFQALLSSFASGPLSFINKQTRPGSVITPIPSLEPKKLETLGKRTNVSGSKRVAVTNSRSPPNCGARTRSGLLRSAARGDLSSPYQLPTSG